MVAAKSLSPASRTSTSSRSDRLCSGSYIALHRGAVDAQAAMARIASEEPGPAQQYARQARKWIAKRRERDRNVRIEFRWCPAHSGVAGNEEADKWAKQAAEEPDARGVEWMGYKDRYGRRLMPPPQISSQPKAGDFGKEVGRGVDVVEEEG